MWVLQRRRSITTVISSFHGFFIPGNRATLVPLLKSTRCYLAFTLSKGIVCVLPSVKLSLLSPSRQVALIFGETI